jgi:O-antigen ligase
MSLRATLSGRMDTAAKALLVASAFALALPTAWVSVFLIPLAFFWLLSGRFQYKYQRIRENPAAWMPMALFALYGIGVLYSSAAQSQALDYFAKYHKLLYIPIVVSFLDDATWRRRALDAFLVGMLLVLAVSYLKWMGLYPHVDIGQGYYAFKGRIVHGIFMAFAVYLFLERAFRAGKWRWAWAVLAILALFNLFVLVNGRSGQVAVVAILVWFFLERLGWRAALAVVILVPALLWAWSESPSGEDARLFHIAKEIPSAEGQHPGSAGQRMQFIETTFALVAEHPILGGGTGSIVNEYRRYAIQHGYEPGLTNVANPHNEYLLTAQHLGLVGLGLLLYMGWLQWRAGGEIGGSDGNSLRALVIVIGVASLFNSLVLDAGEGKFYCLLAGIYLSAWRPDMRSLPVARAP